MSADAQPPAPTWELRDCDEARVDALASALQVHPLLARLLILRGLTDEVEAASFLRPTLADMHDPFLMRHMDRAVELVLHALDGHQRIIIHGDYDVDGISSVSVLYEFLRDLGANVGYFIPQRDRDGYGVSLGTIRRIHHEGAELLITTDCGISNADEIALAKALGMTTIIVDHHTLPPQLPAADAILNPLHPECAFPFKQLAAVGVTFNFVVALRARLRELGLFEHIVEPDLRLYLDLVALGTIADVVPLIDENRLFARVGLEVLTKRQRAGINALLERACPKHQGSITTQTVSFQLAPRLNAAGRMGDASICVELLTTRQYARAMELAETLDGLNRARQESEREIMEDALIQAAEQAALDRPILVVAGEDWNRGVLGIVASRLMERYGRPAVLLGITDGVGKGSARSIEGISLIEALRRVEHLLQTFGGHNAAAGLAISAEHIDELRTRLPLVVADLLHDSGLPGPRLRIDADVTIDELDTQLMRDLPLLAPFGMGNPEPVFTCVPERVSRVRIVGTRHLRARFHGDTRTLDGIGFSMGDDRELLEDHHVTVAFAPRISTYKGRRRLELHLKAIRPLDTQPSADADHDDPSLATAAHDLATREDDAQPPSPTI